MQISELNKKTDKNTSLNAFPEMRHSFAVGRQNNVLFAMDFNAFEHVKS